MSISEESIKLVSSLIQEYYGGAYKYPKIAWSIIHEITIHYPALLKEIKNKNYQTAFDQAKKLHNRNIRLALAKRLVIDHVYPVGILRSTTKTGFAVVEQENSKLVSYNPMSVDSTLHQVYHELNPNHFEN